MKPLKERATKELVEIPISIPTKDGKKIVKIKAEVLKDTDGEIYLPGATVRLIDKIKEEK